MTGSDSIEDLKPKKCVRNHLIWLGPFLTFAGAVSYFVFFSMYPVVRDFPWINLPIVLSGVVVSGVGAWRSILRTTGFWRRFLGVIGCAFSGAVACLFCAYIFYISYQLPEATSVSLNLSEPSEFSLVDHNGRHVRLTDYRGRKLVLSFYRGHW